MSLSPPVADQPTRPEDRVPVKTKVAFGLGAMVGNFTSNLTKELINPIYVVALGLSPALVGMAMVVFRLYDAINDPIMGWISDNTRSRWGRRRPWLALGAILCAFALPMMWLVPADWSDSSQLAWLIVAGLVLYTCTTIFCVPYESFLLELTPDYRERTRVSSWKMVVSSFSGLLIGWSWFITQLPFFANPETGKPDAQAGAIGLTIAAGALIIAFGLAPVFLARERFYNAAKTQAKVSLRKNFTATLQNRAFMMLVPVAFLAVTGSGLAGGIQFFTRLYYVAGSDAALAAKLAGVQATFWLPISFVAVLIFQRLANRFSKTHALFIALGCMIASVAIRWWVYIPSMPYLSLAPNVLAAFGMTGLWQMLPAMNADVVDADELETRARREGAFAAIFSWFMKLSFTVGIGLPGLIVGLCGFVVAKGSAQADGVMTAMRLCEIFIPTVFILVALVLLLRYPLSASRMAEIRRELEARRGAI